MVTSGAVLDTTDRHGHDVAATGADAGLHDLQRGIFAGARHQPAAKAAATDLQAGSLQRLNAGGIG